MAKYQYIKLDSILAKYHRDFRGLGINEGDAIEWIGEALGFAKIHGNSEEAIAYMEVKNYQAEVPNGLHYIIQIAKSNSWTLQDKDSCSTENILQELGPIHSISTEDCTDCAEGYGKNLVPVDCEGRVIGDYEVAYYRPFFDLQYEYLGWANKTYAQGSFSPVRLGNHTFFNSLVCTVPGMEGLYNNMNSRDEYTIVQDQIRFNFKDGFVAVAYLRQMTDPETGYPMIPDDESAKAAITYYLAWKIKQREMYNHREGAERLVAYAEQHWLKYIKQFKAKTKMPSTIDDYQDMMENSSYLIPRRKRYENFFGKMGTAENRPFNTPGRTQQNFSKGAY
jgi:hypothetical protein